MSTGPSDKGYRAAETIVPVRAIFLVGHFGLKILTEKAEIQSEAVTLLTLPNPKITSQSKQNYGR